MKPRNQRYTNMFFWIAQSRQISPVNFLCRKMSEPSGSSGNVDGIMVLFRHSPLAVACPSPLLLLNYPLVVSNVKVLNEKIKGTRPKTSLAATIRLLRETYTSEGVLGLYKGGHIFLLHQAIRDGMRFVVDRGLRALERRLGWKKWDAEDIEPKSKRRRFLVRLALKYSIDSLCYPVLLVSTRTIIKNDQETSWQSVCTWSREEGLLSLFAGLTASLISMAVEEAMEMILAYCIERHAKGNQLDVSDKLVLKACGSSVLSVFTSPVNHVGVIQRCQSRLPGLPEPRSVASIVRGLPWRGSFNQLLLFGGILTLNVRLIQWKLQMQAENEEE